MKSLCTIATAIFCISIALPHAAAQDWPRFRGSNGAGVSPTDVVWTENDRLWKTKLPGKGHSSPVLWGNRLFITSGDQQSGQRHLICLNAADGRTLWTRSFPVANHRQHEDNSWASGTPAVDERHVYVPWASPKDYLVVALDHAGNEKWRVDLGPFNSGHGFGVSLIVHDGLVIIPNEQEGKCVLVALDRDTGKERWQVKRRSKTTYSTPCVWQPKDRPAEIIFGNYEHGVTSIDPKSGAINWEVDVFDKRHMETSIASCLIAGDLVIGCSGWLGVRKEVIAVRPPDHGGKAEVAWKITRGSPLVPTPLVKDDFIFLWEDDGIVTGADVRTGNTHWQERVDGNFYASPICAGKRLINVTRTGEVVTVAAGKQFEELGRFSLGEASFSTPAIVGDVLYVRTFHHMLAFKGHNAEQR
jgi:outer membrane protein assembly factor BamB